MVGQDIFYQQYLTMSENFKIRKNTSLKDIKQIQLSKKQSKDLNNWQSKHVKKNLLKLIHLEPIKSNQSNQPELRKAELKFDLTQPVNIKASIMNRQDSRYDNALITPLHLQADSKQKSLDKQNRPSSMNELNYLNLARMKLTLQNTLKNDSSRLVYPVKKECGLDEIRLNEILNRNSQNKLIKSHSRARLLRLGQKDKKKLADEQKIQSQVSSQATTFKKGIIDHIFSRNVGDQRPYLTLETKQSGLNELSNIPISQSNLSIDTYHNSPLVRKSEPIFDVNCSTINQRQENASSFISKKAVEEFIQPLQNVIEFNQEKVSCQKKRKMQIDKIRRKFPQNFFK